MNLLLVSSEQRAEAFMLCQVLVRGFMSLIFHGCIIPLLMIVLKSGFSGDGVNFLENLSAGKRR